MHITEIVLVLLIIVTVVETTNLCWNSVEIDAAKFLLQEVLYKSYDFYEWLAWVELGVEFSSLQHPANAFVILIGWELEVELSLVFATPSPSLSHLFSMVVEAMNALDEALRSWWCPLER